MVLHGSSAKSCVTLSAPEQTQSMCQSHDDLALGVSRSINSVSTTDTWCLDMCDNIL